MYYVDKYNDMHISMNTILRLSSNVKVTCIASDRGFKSNKDVINFENIKCSQLRYNCLEKKICLLKRTKETNVIVHRQ